MVEQVIEHVTVLVWRGRDIYHLTDILLFRIVDVPPDGRARRVADQHALQRAELGLSRGIV